MKALMHGRLRPRTAWRGSRLAHDDILRLDEAARLATRHAGEEITIDDIVRAAARGEIRLHAIIGRAVTMEPCAAGVRPINGDGRVPAGALLPLTVEAAEGLAVAGRARWRTVERIDTEAGLRYDAHRLADDEPDLEATADACRILGRDLHALADAWRDEPAPAPTAAVRSDDWKDTARAIADTLHQRDAQNGARDSVAGIAERAAVELRRRGVVGPSGRTPSAGTVKREALSGRRWKRPD